ncbi:dihydrolipoamide acetyltransferase family protein [Aestuariivirga sp.]|uniref:dihydrolipoamide acetyltransferase family protein n=1 Tax=Aestuariivirga sp. TaxID=2650926 RepID=UPI0039E2DBAD
MSAEVILPKVDMDMTTGTIAVWHVKDGDTVKKGQPLFDIETDKAAMEIESPADGVIKIGNAPVKAVVPIGTVVAMIYGAGEEPKAFSGGAAASAAPAAAAEAAPSAPAAAAPAAASVSDSDGKARATPLARRLAKQQGISLAALAGTGPRGRIVAADLAKAKPAAAAPAAAAPAAASLAAGMSTDAVKALYQPGSYSVTPLDGMRRTIAQRLVQSKQTVPHFYLTASCTLDELLAVRERLNAQAPKGPDKQPLWKLSVNDFIIKALAVALQRVPAANVTFTDEGILQHTVSDVGVAVAIEGGLFTPVIRAAETKSLSQISIEMKDLAARARARQLKPADYQGGTSAVSNLGMFGVEQFNAIINPPHATILAVGAGVETFVPVNRQPVLKTQMKATLSCDHRAVDGAVGAQLLKAFRELVEEPALMLA